MSHSLKLRLQSEERNTLSIIKLQQAKLYNWIAPKNIHVHYYAREKGWGGGESFRWKLFCLVPYKWLAMTRNEPFTNEIWNRREFVRSFFAHFFVRSMTGVDVSFGVWIQTNRKDFRHVWTETESSDNG